MVDTRNCKQISKNVEYKSKNGLYKTIQGELGAIRGVEARLKYWEHKIGLPIFLNNFSLGSLKLTVTNIISNIF